MAAFSNKDESVVTYTRFPVPSIHDKGEKVAIQPYVHLSKYENGYKRKREGTMMTPITKPTAYADCKWPGKYLGGKSALYVRCG